MENKYLKYLLLAGVIAIWGIIGWKVIKGLGEDEKPISINIVTQKIDYAKVKDSFSLFADYSDPFIPEDDSLEMIDKSKLNAGVGPVVLKDSVARKPDYSYIKYVGLISGHDKKRRIAIVNFRGNDIFLKEKGMLEDFKLIRIEKEFLIFLHRGSHLRIIRKAN